MTGGQTVSCVHAQALQSMVALVMEAEIQRSGGILTVTCLLINSRGLQVSLQSYQGSPHSHMPEFSLFCLNFGSSEPRTSPLSLRNVIRSLGHLHGLRAQPLHSTLTQDRML